MKKMLGFLMIICCMMPLLCTVPAVAEQNLEGSLEPGCGDVQQYPLREYLNLWKVESYTVDSRGFEFSIQISDRTKEYTFQSKDDSNPGIVVVERESPNFRLLLENNILCGCTEDIEVYILGHSQKFNEYPDDPGMPETVFSLLLNEETQSTVLSGLDVLVTGAKLETEADAEAFMPILVQYLSASLDDIAPSKEPTPKWPIIAAICGGAVLVVTVPAVAFINIKRKRRKEAV